VLSRDRRRHDPTPSTVRGTDLRYAIVPDTLTHGHAPRLLRGGGEAFPAMLEAIRGAERFIHLETYILAADRTGRRFAEALVARARAGVKVRFLWDAVGGLGLPDDYVAELHAAGIETAVFHPVAPWRPRFALNQRDHRKILVVDGKVGFTGGMNLSDDYAPVSEGGVGWYDVHLRIEGPAVTELGRVFRRSWLAAGGRDFKMPEPAPDEGRPGEALVQILSNEGRRRRTPIRRAYLHAIRRARSSIAIENAYFIPDLGLRRALANAVKRGVQVRVIVPGRSDVPAVAWASRRLYAGLLRAGVTLYEWQGRMMHAKTAVIDETWSTVGSCNLDYRSFNINLEVIAVIVDRVFGRRMAESFALDLADCREIVAAEWKRRPWWHRVVEWFWFRFRSML
jgi:cardiolipin synthase